MLGQAELALEELGLQRGPDDVWVDAARELAAVACEAGVLVGWLDLAWDRDTATPLRWLRDVEHVPAACPRQLATAATRARARRARGLRRCALCDAGLLPGHLH